ncbi:MAG: methionyl-tRNA formyltransferase [Cytophagaceae bacterium]|nr:methionyl-tRNA formyltransferase [Cytophagaceae bacterium]
MGTPEFAVASLRSLVEAGCPVVAVITAPDKPAGRGHQLQQSAVKQYALAAGLPVLQPEKLKNPAFLEELKVYQADLQVVVAFRMLPELVWAMPPKGTFNLHASLLPQYRGAAPINWAIINGETETGATTFFIQQEIDTGQLIFQEKEPIYPDDTAGSLHDRLMEHGARLVLKTVRAIEAGDYPQMAQPQGVALKMAPKIFRETCEINWNQPVARVRDFIRGLSPYPAAWTMWQGKTLKIFRANEAKDEEPAEIGSYRSDNRSYLHFRCAEGWLAVDELQLEGKRRMSIEEFLRGARVQ